MGSHSHADAKFLGCDDSKVMQEAVLFLVDAARVFRGDLSACV